MRSLRRLGFALWLAVALAAGQHFALLHDLGHASEQLSHKQDSKPASSQCDKHFATAQLVGAPVADWTPPLAACAPRALALVDFPVPAARAPAYRSRAPPALL